MKVDLFDFTLPDTLIAQHPAEPRDASRLLHITPDALADRAMRELPSLLRPGDMLVFNDTKVIPARLSGKRGDAQVEVTLHKAVDALTWRAFARPAKRLRVGDTIHFAADFIATVTAKQEGEVTLRFEGSPEQFMQSLAQHGHMPLPPYIRQGRDEAADSGSYQTIYARHPGAVAAPTAGLHFTPQLLAALEARGIHKAFVTLHVGAGTFLPVKADDTKDHVMHSELAMLTAESADAINRARKAGGRVVAVGTTALRVLESAADESGVLHPYHAETDIFITPGYRFRAVDVLLTNFHLPRSTLFMLVCAFAGTEHMKEAYAHAIAQNYRFYSYGDACLLELTAQDHPV